MNENIYSSEYVKRLFDSMSQTYGFVNYISSFGFTERWRKQFISYLPKQNENAIGYDLMTGMGENWTFLLPRISPNSTLFYVDISEVMLAKADEKVDTASPIRMIKKQADVLNSGFLSNSADFIVSSFGLKTFSKEQQSKLAMEVARLLKKGGDFSFVEISIPKNPLLKIPLLFYLKFCIPIIGKLFMGNSNDYKMLGIYTDAFQDSSHFYNELKNAGLNVSYKEFFFGCATCVYGNK